MSNFAEGVYKNIGKSSPDDVVFWICIFSLNEHKVVEEVGLTPDEYPGNVTLMKAQHGAVIVLIGCVKPIRRSW